MVNEISFFDVLGVDTAEEAAQLWPASRLSSGAVGADSKKTVQYLKDALKFRRICPGSDGSRIGFRADVYIKNPSQFDQSVFVLSQMPDVTFRLLDTAKYPARIFVAKCDSGPEIVIESLPVEIRLPAGMLEPDPLHLSDVNAPPTGELNPDDLTIVLRSDDSSSVFVRVRVRMTEEMDFVIEPAVPVSIGRCKFLSLPCKAVHELSLVPSPTLAGEHMQGEQALQWTRHGLDQLSTTATYSGVLTARTIDLDETRTPFPELLGRMNALRSSKGKQEQRPVEFILEDIALPFCNIVTLPIPSHGQFGLRRRIELGDPAEQAFQFSMAPVEIALPWSWRVLIDELWIRTVGKGDTQPCFFRAALVFGSRDDKANAFTLGLADNWTLQAGWRAGKGIDLFTVFGVTLCLWGAMIGWCFGRARDAAADWSDLFQFLLDLSVKSKGGSSSGTFEIVNATGGPLNVALRNVGWDRGSVSFEKASLPEGAMLAIARVFYVEIDEMGFVTESNGAEYFSFSGGLAVVGKSRKGGGGICVYRLRGRTGGNPKAPGFLLDGISLDIFIKVFHLYGFGLVSEFSDQGTKYSEFGFGIKVDFRAVAQDFSLGAQFFYGHAEGVLKFKYLIGGLQFSPIPMGVVQMLDVRALVAYNMTPDIPAPDGNSENLRLFRWYKQNGQGVITLSAKNRSLSGWKRMEDCWAGGLGAGVSLPVGRFVNLYTFTFIHSSPENAGLMVLLEAYLFRSGDPVAYGVLDLDWENGVWGVAFGVALTISNLCGLKLPNWIGDKAILTGTLYIGNKPMTIALGRLADQATWLSFSFDAPFLDSGGTLAYCFEAVDRHEGPVGAGFAISVRGGWSFGIGSLQLYGAFGFLAGYWRNEATSGGWAFWFAIGLRIKIFYIFTFGLSVKVDFAFLGQLGGSSYETLSCLITIETPWFLPDVTIRVSWTWGDQNQLENLEVISTPITAASAVTIGGAAQRLNVSPLFNGPIEEKAVYSLAKMKGASQPAMPTQALKSIPVAIDSTIAIDFKPAVENKTSKGSPTEDGVGAQNSKPPARNSVTSDYQITAFGVKRRPRFGADSGKWMDSLKPGDTRLKKTWEYDSADELMAAFTEQDYGWKWNADFLREGKIDPREILLNSTTPYTIVSSNPETDESIARNMPGWPCCPKPPKEEVTPWHVLDFQQTTFGGRAPASQLFSASQSRLKWLVSPPPFVVPGKAASPASHVAVFEASRGNGAFAIAAFNEAVYILDLSINWLLGNPTSSLIISAFRGLDLVATKEFKLDQAPEPLLRFLEQQGFDSVVFTYTNCLAVGASTAKDWIEIISMRYVSVKEIQEIFTAGLKCKAAGEKALKGYGKFAWFPNHEYAITFTTKVKLSKEAESNGQGGVSKETEVEQTTFFRTKGMIGLNAVKRTGDEVTPYVESCYPAAGPVTLYREEPLALAFNEDFNIVLPQVPFERMPNPDQMFGSTYLVEWVLTVDKIGGAGGGEHLSETSEDWLTAHGNGAVGAAASFAIADFKIVTQVVRQAPTTNPFKIRYSAMLAVPSGCNQTDSGYHKSMVLLHTPVDPHAAVGALPMWPANAVLRANLRLKGGPFVERTAFKDGAETAFEFFGENGKGDCAWKVSEGAMVLSTKVPGRCYAVFGEKEWNHFQIHASVEPAGLAAGLAIAVEASVTIDRALVAVVDESARELKIIALTKGAAKTIDSKPLTDDSQSPYGIEIVAFDDVLRVSVGDIEVECDREEFRDGKVALMGQAGSKFARLIVEPLDGYRFEGRISRFESFADHIRSFDGKVTPTPANAIGTGMSATVSSLFHQTETELTTVMKLGAERESRQRLFDTWAQQLKLPLRTRVTKLEISPVQSAGATEMLLMESPEPLPFSRDVSLKVFKLSWVVSEAIDNLQEATFQIDFRFDRMAGIFVNGKARNALSRAACAVRARMVENYLQYEIYDVKLQPMERRGVHIDGRLSNVIRRTDMLRPELPLLYAAIEALAPDELMFLDNAGVAIGPQSPLVLEDVWEAVPVAILTDGDECRALIIPLSPDGSQTVPLTKGPHILAFSLDRMRYRSINPDKDSSYKREAVLNVMLS